MSFKLTPEEGEFLVKLARKAVEERLKRGRVIEMPEGTPEKLKKHCGVFVTLKSLRQGERELRGCIGVPYPNSPLARAVIDSAINSATQDPRFPSPSLEELDRLVFEVSVLTPPQPIEVKKPLNYPSKIRVGQNGLIVEKGYHKGLLLPQVPVEWSWDEEQFLSQCCLKAGLSPDCWLTRGIRIYKFKAIVFEEVTPGGEVQTKELE